MNVANAVFLAVDARGFPHALYTAWTALKRRRANPFDLFIAVPTGAIPDEWVRFAEEKIGAHVVSFDVEGRMKHDRTANALIPTASNYRYFFDEFLHPNYERLIYLDYDLRLRGDLSRLFDLDLDGHAFAAVPDGCLMGLSGVPGSTNEWLDHYREGLGFERGELYCNSGVMLIDRAAWNARDLSRQVIATWEERHDICLLADQSALNLLSRGDFQPISPVWNMFSFHWFGAPVRDLVSPVCLHFAGKTKPWHGDWHHTPIETWRRSWFFRNSPWAGSARLDRATYRRTWKRWIREVRGRKPPRLPFRYPASDVRVYRKHLETFAFADVRQGLVTRENGKRLRLTKP